MPVIEPQTPEQKRARITALSQQISEQQTSAPTPATPMSAGSQACTDVCTIKTTICDNAREICKLADELQRHFQQQVSELIPVLASRLPRALYRSIVSTFVARCQRALEGATHERRAPAPVG